MKKLLLFLSLFFASGCTVAPFVSPIVTGIVMWSGGEANKYYDADSVRTYRSTKMALRELGIPITKDEPRKDGYRIVAGDSNRFNITIKKVNPHITLVSIRVNFMGDKPFAELVYKTIDAHMDVIEFNSGRPINVKNLVK